MSDTLDAIVVGLGAMGSNALAVLARRGKRVLGLDRFDPPHNFGSSHGGSRVIRLSYFEHPDYVPLLKRAYDAFDRLAQDSGETLRIENGLVMGGAPGNAVAAGMLRSARTHDLPVSALDGAELMRRYPQFTVPADWEVVFEARGGFVRPEATIRAAERGAAPPRGLPCPSKQCQSTPCAAEPYSKTTKLHLKPSSFASSSVSTCAARHRRCRRESPPHPARRSAPQGCM